MLDTLRKKGGEREREREGGRESSLERERQRQRKRKCKIQLSQTESKKCQDSMLYKAVPSRNGEGRRVTMEPLFSFFLISRGSIRKYAHYYYLLQAKVQLSIIFSASFWIFHSRLILKWKKNVLTSFATRRVLAGEISTFPCLV